MNAYVLLQQALVAARQDAFRSEADTTRLLASASTQPAVSAGERAADLDRLPHQQPVAVAPRSLGAAAAADRLAVAAPTANAIPSRGKPSAGDHHLAGGRDDCGCATDIAPAA
jgi:hypothetical protein